MRTLSASPVVQSPGHTAGEVTRKPFACPAGTHKDGNMLEPAPADVVLAASAHPAGSSTRPGPGLGTAGRPDPMASRPGIAAHHRRAALLRRARRPPSRPGLPPLPTESFAPPSELLDNVHTAAHVLTGLLRDLGTGRAWHPSGHADAAGWTGMAVTEILVHGHDVASVLGVELPLPVQVCARTVARVFPWMPTTTVAADQLLLATTGRVHVDGLVHDPNWWWHSPPLSQWKASPAADRPDPPGSQPEAPTRPGLRRVTSTPGGPPPKACS